MKKYKPVLILAAVVAIIQLFTLITDTGYLLTQLTMSAYYVIVALGLCMVMGYSGQISLGQAGFFAIGGYTTAFLSTIDFSLFAEAELISFLKKAGILSFRENLYGDLIIYLNPWFSLLAALIIAGVVAYILGVSVLRLKGHYLAMATMGFGIIIYRIVLGTSAFGEADGITNVPPFLLFPGLEVSGDFKSRIQNYYVAWFLVVGAMVLLINLINSRVGRALRLLHGGDEAADAMGVNTARYKIFVFVLGAVFSAAAGFFMTHYNGGIGPSEAGVVKSVRYLAIVAVGGMANLWGTLITGFILNFMSLRGIFGHYDDLVFGLILVGMMIFMPEGFVRKEAFDKVSGILKKLMKTNKGMKKTPETINE